MITQERFAASRNTDSTAAWAHSARTRSARAAGIPAVASSDTARVACQVGTNRSMSAASARPVRSAP